MRGGSGEGTALAALAAEAKRRGTTYGKLVAGTTVREQDEIVREFGKYAGKSPGNRRAENGARSMTGHRRQDRGYCTACRHSGMEAWPGRKTALRCLSPGEHQGRVTHIFPTGHRPADGECAAPAWCRGFKQRK